VLEIVEITFSDTDILTDCTGESVATTGDRLSRRFGRFLIMFAGLVAILSLLSKGSGLLKFSIGIPELLKFFTSILSAD
jgi:hypothetical protein